ncbi:MAG: TetR family transcriptional regulator [Alphaproteobacteria bacterium]|nr:TetR family transcriptional regulator [Alphaproteobacteria bacterium]
MTKKTSRRQDLAADIAALLLRDGVAILPLRDLAARLGTSDRMLLYYFGNQADLVEASLAHLSAILAARLERALPPVRLPSAALARKLTHAMQKPDIAPILKVWADVAARGARGEEPFAKFALRAVETWLEWIGARLAVSDHGRREKEAAAILVAIEGARMLELFAPGVSGKALPLLFRSFD